MVENTKRVFLLSRTRRIVKYGTVGDRGIPIIHDKAYAEGRLHGRFVKAREGPASVAAFKLGDRVFPAIRIRPVEAAQLVIQCPQENNVNLRGADGQGLFHGERRRLVLGVQGNLGLLGHASGGDGRFLEIDFRSVKRNRGSRLRHLDINGFLSRKGIVSKVGRKLKLVVFGDHRAGEPRKLRERSTPQG